MNATVTNALSFDAMQAHLLAAYRAARPYLPYVGMALLMLFLLAAPEMSFAQEGGAMPWEGVFEKMAQSMTGPWVKWLAVIAIAVGGILFGLGELNGPFQYALRVGAGFSVAVAAVALAGIVVGG